MMLEVYLLFLFFIIIFRAIRQGEPSACTFNFHLLANESMQKKAQK
jgi:hypothetical protein